jgi:hypothetical protein
MILGVVQNYPPGYSNSQDDNIVQTSNQGFHHEGDEEHEEFLFFYMFLRALRGDSFSKFRIADARSLFGE